MYYISPMDAAQNWIFINIYIYFQFDHMAKWNLFDVVNSVILKFPADDF